MVVLEMGKGGMDTTNKNLVVSYSSKVINKKVFAPNFDKMMPRFLVILGFCCQLICPAQSVWDKLNMIIGKIEKNGIVRDRNSRIYCSLFLL